VEGAEVVVVDVVVRRVAGAVLAHGSDDGREGRHNHAALLRNIAVLLEDLALSVWVDRPIGFSDQIVVVLVVPVGFRELRVREVGDAQRFLPPDGRPMSKSGMAASARRYSNMSQRAT
jgi:hypothetical protein